MSDPQITLLLIEGNKLSLSEGLRNSFQITIDPKCNEILVNPTTGSRTFSGRTTRYSPRLRFPLNLHSINHHDIQQVLLTELDNSLSCESLAKEISTAATNLGFGFNGFVMKVFITITYYLYTYELAPANSNTDIEELYRMVLLGRIKRKKRERSMKIETESCSICLDDLSGSTSKHGEPTHMTCSHVFHDRCLLEWLRRKNTCPMCRTVLYDQ